LKLAIALSYCFIGFPSGPAPINIYSIEFFRRSLFSIYSSLALAKLI
jgi:hypothetical protein